MAPLTEAKMCRVRFRTLFLWFALCRNRLVWHSVKMKNEYLLKRKMSNAEFAQILIRWKINLILILLFMEQINSFCKLFSMDNPQQTLVK